MPNFTFENLINPQQTEEDSFDELKMLLEDITPAVSQVTTNFAVGSYFDSTIRLCAHTYQNGIEDSSNIVATQFLKYSANDALTNVCSGFYDEQRKPAKPTQGYMRLELTDANSGPYTITADDNTLIKYDADNNIQWYIRDTATIDSSNLIADVFVECVSSGTLGNVVVGSLLSCDSLSGISVSNPIYSGSTWVTQYGIDEETDSQLELRASTKWSTLNRGESSLQFLKNAVLNNTASNVSFCTINDDNTRGAGTVDVYVANKVDAITQGQLNLLQSGTLDIMFFGNDSSLAEPRVKAFSAENIQLDSSKLSGEILFKGSESQVKSSVQLALEQFISTTPIGGYYYTGLEKRGVLFGDLEDVIKHIPNVIGVVFKDLDQSIIELNIYDKLIKPTSWTNFTYRLVGKR